MATAPGRSAGPPDLRQLVTDELVALRELVELLGDERAALEERDPVALLTASQRKAAAVSRATALGKLRDALPAAVPADLTPLVAELRQLARRCRDLNDANGVLIRGQRRRVEHALRVLTGGDPGVEVYGRDGGARVVRGGRSPLASY